MSATIDISCVKVEPEQEQTEETKWETDLGVDNNNTVHQAENNLDVELGPVKIETETFIERQTARPRKQKQAPSVAENAAKGYTISYLCPHCPRQFDRSDELEIHTQIHTDKLLYKCSYCPNSFSHKSIFTAHMFGHTGKYPYNCPDCPEGFLKNCHLKNHMLRLHAYKRSSDVHNGKNSLQCPQCPRGFMTLDELEIHLQIHSDKLPHKCPYCTDSFAHKSNYLSHIYEHTGEFPFKCPECQQRFPRKYDLTRHVWKCKWNTNSTKAEAIKDVTREAEEELKRIEPNLQNAIEPESNVDEAIIASCYIKKAKEQEQKQEPDNSSLQSPSINPNLTVNDERSPTIKVESLDVDNLNVEISQADDNILINTPSVEANVKAKSREQPSKAAYRKQSNNCKICKREFKRLKDLRSHQRCCTKGKRQLRARSKC